jgi:hypothetical protein
MECLKWQENGLLVVSGEADARQKEEFIEHTKVCAECKNEADQYTLDKKNFFSLDFLAEAPPQAIDSKIIAACSQKAVSTFGFNLFSGIWMKKALLSTFFLAFGMGAGVYFTVHYFSSNNSGIAVSKPTKASAAQPQQAMQQTPSKIQGATAASARKDSLKSNEAVFPSGQKSSEGIITVDTKKE